MTKKEKIFQAALHLFVENGIDNTATAKIAAEAGVATGTLFHHFKNKGELINALYLEVKTSIAEAMQRGVEDHKDGKAVSRQTWNNFMAWSLNNQELFQFNALICESPLITKNTKQHLAQDTFRFLTEHIEVGQQTEILRDLPAKLLSSLASSLLQRSAQFFIENPEAFKDPNITDQAFESYWGMIAKQE